MCFPGFVPLCSLRLCYKRLPVRLPVDRVLPELVAALRDASGVVLVAPTGAGKTTRVPPALLEFGSVVMLEPRRVAARAAARRIADERGTRLGGEVGYRVRLDNRAGPDTRLLVATEGVLLRMLADDPFLDGTAVLIFDEFHERNLQSDLALAMARRVQQDARPDLKLVVMSATIDPVPVAKFLDVPVLKSEGFLHPVTVEYDDADPAGAVRKQWQQTDGDVLVFLPGVGEIRRLAAQLHDLPYVLPLHGSLSPEEQDAALRTGGPRKIVLTTNVAETSVTVPGVRAVVDTGLVRVPRFDPTLGLPRLALERTSKASADQRKGRAGRTAPGHCVRLWTEADHRGRRDALEPEVRRADLAGAALELLSWGERDLEAFPWFEAPDRARLEQAIELLERLGAVQDGVVTELGRRMARLPVHPRLARLVLEGERLGARPPAALAAAVLSEWRGGRRAAVTDSDSDVLDAMQRPSRTVKRLAERLAGRQRGAPDDDAVLRAIFAAFPDRLARRRAPGSDRAVLVGGRGVRLGRESAVRDAEFLVCFDLDAGRGEARCRGASKVERAWLPEGATEDSVTFDGERVVGMRRTVLWGLVLDERPIPPPKEQAARLLAEAARERTADELVGHLVRDIAVRSFLLRLFCLRAWRPELGLPEVTAHDVLPELCFGCRSLADLERAPWLAALKGRLTFRQRQLLDQLAPERIGRGRVTYEHPDKPPVLAARIQDLLGREETPTVAGGRVKVLLHLLAPNGRPQQVTGDLASFWDNTYPVVRKELRGRYPKHAWPKNPREP